MFRSTWKCPHNKSGRDADDRHGTEERAPRIHLSLHKGLVGETGHPHIETVGLTGDNANRTKCILHTLKDHCKLRSNEIEAATAYNQQV